MGSGVSATTPPSSPEGSVGDSQRTLRTTDEHKARKLSGGIGRKPELTGSAIEDNNCLVRTNRVAPVIIRNCREEFQANTDFKEPIIMGSMAGGMMEHPLLKGKYFLVRDTNNCTDELKTLDKYKAPNVRQANGGYAVFGMGQPSRDGLNHITAKLLEEGHGEILLFNLREEPVFFMGEGHDMVTYSIRDSDNLQEAVILGKTVTEAAEQEINLRKNIIDLATVQDANKFYFYNDLAKLGEEPHILPVEFEDYLQVSEEIYTRPSFNSPEIRYMRLCLPIDGAPSTKDIDHFINFFRESHDFFTNKHDFSPALVFSCHTGIGRTHMGMVMGWLILAHISGFPPEANKKGLPINEKNPNYQRGEYVAIQNLIRTLPHGSVIKNQVDVAIDSCSELFNLKLVIAETKAKLDGIKEDYIIEGHSARTYLWQKCCQYLDRYFFLICFNAYLREQFHVAFCSSFSSWMHCQPELMRIRSHIDISEWRAPVDLVSKAIRFLVSDDYIGLDVLSSQMDVQVSNYRKVTALPVYGMAQPVRNGLSKVVSHLLSSKHKHPVVAVVNLRDDLVVECDAVTYGIRDCSDKEQPIELSGITRKELEEKEEQLKKEIRSKKSFVVYHDLSDPPMSKQMSSVLTNKDMFEQQKLQTPEVLYYRVPMDGDKAVEEQVYDQLMEILTDLREVHNDENGPALLFYCRTGKSRTTTAMALAGLVICHKKGFPYGAKPGEQERVSCPNAQYTKGDFIVIQKLVQLLPNGQQVKREVDFILDRCFETMTPMHFHMREVIFVTYNKIKKAKTEEERRRLKWRSLDYLERYFYLILFNAYLHAERRMGWRRPFSHWMKQVAAKAGVYNILDSLAFYDFEQTTCSLQTMAVRWQNRHPNAPVRGVFS